MSLLGALAAGSNADPSPRATAQTLRDSTSDEVMVVRAPLVLVLGLFYNSVFSCNHKPPSSERFPTAPHNPVRRRSAGSCAPIDHMLTTFGLWVFVGTAPARDLMSHSRLTCVDNNATESRCERRSKDGGGAQLRWRQPDDTFDAPRARAGLCVLR